MDNIDLQKDAAAERSDYAPYPKLDPKDLEPPPPIAVQSEASRAVDANPYVVSSPTLSKNKMESVREALGRWGKRAAEAAKATEDLAGSVWQHCEWTDPDFGVI